MKTTVVTVGFVMATMLVPAWSQEESPKIISKDGAYYYKVDDRITLPVQPMPDPADPRAFIVESPILRGFAESPDQE